jgi:hypothetical protein
VAPNDADGALLWHFHAAASIPSPPISDPANGAQYVAVSSAGVRYSFALPAPKR